MTFIIDTDNLENNNFQLTENESGDLVLTHKSTGATFDYDSTNEQWVASGGIKTPALEAERAVIGSTPIERVEAKTASDVTDGVLEFTDLDAKKYGLFVNKARTNGGIVLYFNNNDDTGEYSFWDETGTKHEDQDTIELIEQSDTSTARVTGWIEINNEDVMSSPRIGFVNHLQPHDIVGRIDGYADRGGQTGDDENITSIQIEGEGLNDGADIELWEVL